MCCSRNLFVPALNRRLPTTLRSKMCQPAQRPSVPPPRTLPNMVAKASIDATARPAADHGAAAKRRASCATVTAIRACRATISDHPHSLQSCYVLFPHNEYLVEYLVNSIYLLLNSIQYQIIPCPKITPKNIYPIPFACSILFSICDKSCFSTNFMHNWINSVNWG